jgi:hypothetical protein
MDSGTVIVTYVVVYLGDHNKLLALEAYDADFSAADYSGRTALHVAAATGQGGGRNIFQMLSLVAFN